MARLEVAIRLLLAVAAVGSAAWVLATRWGSVVHGHPAYAVLLIVLMVTGVVLALRARLDRPRGTGRGLLRLAGALLVVLLVGATVWLRPFPAADVTRVAALDSGTVDVVELPGRWELRPTRAPLPVGLVFLPGARVDPQAYLALLRPLAAEGHLVVVVKPPLGIALLAPWAATWAFDQHPEVLRWVVGGHSLGGVAAAGLVGPAEPRIAGLLLWAAYPAGDISQVPVAALSLSGEVDALTTPEDVERTRPLLPASTEFVRIPGAVHAYFGDYGDQPGDGVATTSRGGAQGAIVRRTQEFVASR